MSLRRIVFTTPRTVTTNAPHLDCSSRQIGVRTPAGRPQDPMGWLELRPFF